MYLIINVAIAGLFPFAWQTFINWCNDFQKSTFNSSRHLVRIIALNTWSYTSISYYCIANWKDVSNFCIAIFFKICFVTKHISVFIIAIKLYHCCFVLILSISTWLLVLNVLLIIIRTPQMALSAFGSAGGPVVGIFFLGAIFPQANWIVSCEICFPIS